MCKQAKRNNLPSKLFLFKLVLNFTTVSTHNTAEVLMCFSSFTATGCVYYTLEFLGNGLCQLRVIKITRTQAMNHCRKFVIKP